MDFTLDQDQNLLRDSVGRLLAGTYGFEARRDLIGGEGWSRTQWRRFAELGLLALPFAEEDGGIGGGAVETMIVMEEFGRALSLEPYLPTVVLGAGFLALGCTARERAPLVQLVADGSLVLAFAQAEQQSRFDLHDVLTTARHQGDRWILDGEKRHVIHGGSAGKLIVTARIAGERRERDGIGLFIVDAHAPGIEVRAYTTQDRQPAARISFTNAPAEGVIGAPGTALPLIEQVVDQAIAALCAEAVGAMARALELTIEHLRTREQFGVKIGTFQALQHRAVDMLVKIEEARSMAIFAAMMCGEPDPAERRRAVAMAKALVGRAGKFVGEQAIQLHGGMGMTDEHPVGHYYRRLMMIELMFGDSSHHIGMIAAAA